MDEHVYLFETSMRIAGGRIQVIANAGSNSTDEAIFLTQKAEGLGVDCVLSVVPYYVKPTQEGLYQHFKAIHESTKAIPIIIYNVPSRTGADISVDTIVRLSQLERVVGLKEASPDIEKLSNTVAQTKRGFSVLSGNDPTFLPLLALGGHGVISVIGNIMPLELVDMYNCVMKGDWIRAIEINKKMLALYEALSLEANPIPIKYALYRMGHMRNELRLPLTPLGEANQRKMDAILKTLCLI